MNILTFDIEEWYLESQRENRQSKYLQLNETLERILNGLDRIGIKGTFFCVGELATSFPEVVKIIVDRGHEVGCHSNIHTWLDKMDEKTLRQDTTDAIKALEDVAGQKVTSYRAPAFSITGKNKWAIGVLADCGIESDASIFPAARDFGGFPLFPYDVPCTISYQGVTLKEFPIGLISVFGKKIAYSGGGYFRLIPYWLVNRTMKSRDYNICYFHLADLIHEKHGMMTRQEYEDYFKEPGTFKNRLIRYAKSNVGTGDAFGKLQRLLSDHRFVNIREAAKQTDWAKVKMVCL